jgi:transcriptional regulator with XRE-family HTH domain
VRIIRELQELSQNQLSKLTGIPQATISAIENDRVRLGVERAKVLAWALKCHPGVLVFPGWELPKEAAGIALRFRKATHSSIHTKRHMKIQSDIPNFYEILI